MYYSLEVTCTTLSTSVLHIQMGFWKSET